MTSDVYAKVHEKGGSQVLALADPALIGSAFSAGGNPMTEEVYAKIHERHGSQVLAISDPSLIGSE